MAFPTMQTGDVQHGVVTSNSAAWTLTYPTNLASGDLIGAFLGMDGSPATCSFSDSGWTSIFKQNGNASACCLWFGWKKSDGTETGNFTANLSAAEQGGWRVVRITDWFGDLSGTTNNGVNDSNGVKGTGTSGASTTPDSPSLNPINWAAEDTLWIALAGVDTSRTFSAWPSSYSPGNNTWDDVSGGAGGASLSVAYRQFNTSSEDPGTWTISTSDDWATNTFAVRPAAAAASVFTRKEFPALQAVNRASVY